MVSFLSDLNKNLDRIEKKREVIIDRSTLEVKRVSERSFFSNAKDIVKKNFKARKVDTKTAPKRITPDVRKQLDNEHALSRLRSFGEYWSKKHDKVQILSNNVTNLKDEKTQLENTVARLKKFRDQLGKDKLNVKGISDVTRNDEEAFNTLCDAITELQRKIQLISKIDKLESMDFEDAFELYKDKPTVFKESPEKMSILKKALIARLDRFYKVIELRNGSIDQLRSEVGKNWDSNKVDWLFKQIGGRNEEFNEFRKILLDISNTAQKNNDSELKDLADNFLEKISKDETNEANSVDSRTAPTAERMVVDKLKEMERKILRPRKYSIEEELSISNEVKKYEQTLAWFNNLEMREGKNPIETVKIDESKFPLAAMAQRGSSLLDTEKAHKLLFEKMNKKDDWEGFQKHYIELFSRDPVESEFRKLVTVENVQKLRDRIKEIKLLKNALEEKRTFLSTLVPDSSLEMISEHDLRMRYSKSKATLEQLRKVEEPDEQVLTAFVDTAEQVQIYGLTVNNSELNNKRNEALKSVEELKFQLSQSRELMKQEADKLGRNTVRELQGELDAIYQDKDY
jgi:hypothetical protein